MNKLFTSGGQTGKLQNDPQSLSYLMSSPFSSLQWRQLSDNNGLVGFSLNSLFFSLWIPQRKDVLFSWFVCKTQPHKNDLKARSWNAALPHSF